MDIIWLIKGRKNPPFVKYNESMSDALVCYNGFGINLEEYHFVCKNGRWIHEKEISGVEGVGTVGAIILFSFVRGVAEDEDLKKKIDEYMQKNQYSEK